jgi:hypothetical protein
MKKTGDVMEVFLRTTHFVRGSWPMSLVTCVLIIRDRKREQLMYEVTDLRMFLIIAILLERWGSSVINQRKSFGSCGGLVELTPSSSAVGYGTLVLRGDLPSARDSAPP